MSRVTITFHIDIPDGIVPDVDYAEAPDELVAMVGTTVVPPSLWRVMIQCPVCRSRTSVTIFASFDPETAESCL